MPGTVNQHTLAELDEKVAASLERDVEAAKASLHRYRSSCEKCRPLVSSLLSKAGVGTVNVQAYGVVERGRAAFCPACGRCVYSDES